MEIKEMATHIQLCADTFHCTQYYVYTLSRPNTSLSREH